MSVPTRTRPVTPALPTTPSLAPTTAPNQLGRGMPRQPSTPELPPLPDLIKQQPLPDPLTQQNAQLQAMYQQALQQLQGNSSAMLGMQNQLNALQAQDPTARFYQRQMAQFQGDPFAAQRAQMAQMNAVPQRLSMAWQGMGY